MRRIAASAVCLLTCALSLLAEDKPKPDVSGLWLGVLKVGPVQLRLAFQIDKGKDGALSGKMISLDQNRAEVPCKSVKFADGKFELDLPKIVATYKGTLDDAGKKIKGTYTQLGQDYPLDLDRIDKLPTSKRPQTPKGPFAYKSEEVTFENEAKFKLAGTLTIPKGDGPFPAVVLVTGSGPQDRDETLFEHKPFLVIADHLANNGIACLRYDDRGVGKSGGKFGGSTTADFATDAAAAVKFLKGHKKVNAKKVGICGHSEGGAIAPMVASEHPGDVAFIVLLAGPGVPGDEVLHRQRKDIASQMGAKDADIEKGAKFMAKLFAVAKAAKTTDEAKKGMKEVIEKAAAAIEDEAKRKTFTKAMDLAQAQLSDPWMRWFIAYDPAPALKKVKCPVLALNGDKDLQVASGPNLKAIAEALKAGGNKEVTTVEFKGLNHLFQTCKTGAVSEYGQIEETIAPEVLKKIGAWIGERK